MLGKEGLGQPGRRRHAERIAVEAGVLGCYVALLAGDPAVYRKDAKFPAPEFGLYSTARDLATFYNMMLNEGLHQGKRLLSKTSVQVMTAIHTNDLTSGHSPGMAFGLTWEVVKEPLGSLTYRSIGSFGHGGAFGTHGWIDQKKRLVGVYLVQSTGGGSTYARDAFMTMAASALD